MYISLPLLPLEPYSIVCRVNVVMWYVIVRKRKKKLPVILKIVPTSFCHRILIHFSFKLRSFILVLFG